MDHALAVGVVERTRHFAGDAHGFWNRQLLLTHQARARSFLDQLYHRDVTLPIVDGEIESFAISGKLAAI